MESCGILSGELGNGSALECGGDTAHDIAEGAKTRGADVESFAAKTQCGPDEIAKVVSDAEATLIPLSRQALVYVLVVIPDFLEPRGLFVRRAKYSTDVWKPAHVSNDNELMTYHRPAVSIEVNRGERKCWCSGSPCAAHLRRTAACKYGRHSCASAAHAPLKQRRFRQVLLNDRESHRQNDEAIAWACVAENILNRYR